MSDPHGGFGPGDMLDVYRNIEVQAGGAPVVLQVDAYRNLGYGAEEKGGCDMAIKVKEALVQASARDVWRRAGGSVSYFDVFSGKGSPEAVAAVMQAFYDYHERFIKMFPPDRDPKNPAGLCSLWMADDSLSWQDALQKICHRYIGLDCNGFVGNWLKKCDHSLKLDQNTSKPEPAYQARRQVRKTVAEIEYWDLVVWTNFKHIAAILDEGGGGKPRFYVCQSAGGGPRCNLYEIKAVSPGVFQLRGGIPEKDVAGNVYVISPWSA